MKEPSRYYDPFKEESMGFPGSASGKEPACQCLPVQET